MAKYEISDNTLQNIFVFLDRIKYKGLKENQVLNEIVASLSAKLPTDDEKSKNIL